MILAAAQTIPFDGNIEANLEEHYKLIELAAGNGVQLIVFPELSLTGYVREQARDLAFVTGDNRLEKLQALSLRHEMIIVCGAPLMIGNEVFISDLIFYPDGTQGYYRKQYLFEGENDHYARGDGSEPLITLEQERIAPVICAETSHRQYAQEAADKGATVYAAGIFFEPASMQRAYRNLGGYAKQHSMKVLMANYAGRSYGIEAGGQSAFWTGDGVLQCQLPAVGSGLLIAAKGGTNWKTTVISFAAKPA
jgi:predicted amidohydrolase